MDGYQYIEVINSAAIVMSLRVQFGVPDFQPGSETLDGRTMDGNIWETGNYILGSSSGTLDLAKIKPPIPNFPLPIRPEIRPVTGQLTYPPNGEGFYVAINGQKAVYVVTGTIDFLDVRLTDPQDDLYPAGTPGGSELLD